MKSEFFHVMLELSFIMGRNVPRFTLPALPHLLIMQQKGVKATIFGCTFWKWM